MNKWQRPKNQHRPSTKNPDNRINILTAIIFLLGGAVAFKLYTLQVFRYDYYTAMASEQHSVFSKLEPERGRIFIQDNSSLDKISPLYPIATNKEFALVYAKPNKIENPVEAAKALYEILDKPYAERDANYVISQLKREESNLSDEDWKSFTEMKREEEIKARSEGKIKEYEEKLSKKNDPYEPIKKKVDDEELEKIKAAGIKGIEYLMENDRYYPEGEVGSHLIGFVGFSNDAKKGMYGLEGFFNQEMSGQAGSVFAERNAKGEVMIINDRQYTKPVNGSDLILTVERSVQFAACEKLKAAVLKHGADSGTAIITNPNTGAIIAMCSYPDYDPNDYSKQNDINIFNNPAIFSQYEPGSIFKPLTMALAIDKGKVNPNSTYVDKGSIMIEGWPKPIKNSDFETYGGHGVTTMTQVLENSLNTGAIYAMESVGDKAFAEFIKQLGFGEKTGIELETESPGNIAPLLARNIRPVEAATASFGQGIAATPLQMAVAWGALANGGILIKPYIVKEIITPDGAKIETQPKQVRRVISDRTSMLISGMLVNVVENGHAKRAQMEGYYVAGKTGTAQVADREKGGYADWTIHSFVSYFPADDPEFLIFTRLDHPRDAQYAESTAVPLSKEIAEFITQYYNIPKEREAKKK